MSKTGMTVDIGTAYADRDANAPSLFNARWTTVKASLEAHLNNLADGQRTATNKIGATGAVGDLVYRSGWDATNERIEVKGAVVTEANSTTFYATHVITTAGANNAEVTVKKIYQFTSQDTDGLTAGRPIFLSTTSKGWTGSLPTANNRVQIVGSVLVVDAAAGIVEFDLPGAVIAFGDADDI